MKLVKIYAVVLIGENSLKELFKSSDKDLCKVFKKENRNLGKLGIMYIDNQKINI